MIEVICIETGDSAECELDAAPFTAYQLMRDAREAQPLQGFSPTARFVVDGEPVAHVSYKEIFQYLQKGGAP